MKAVVAAFNQEKALVGAFSVITNLRMEIFEALPVILILLGVCLHELLHLGLGLAGQPQEVVAPVGGGRLVHRAPDQRWGLGSK